MRELDAEWFRRHAHAAVDWIADYFEGIEELPVRAAVRPGEVAGQLPDRPPGQGEDMAAIFADFERIVLPGMTHWQHPSFFAYFPANASPPSVLAELLTAALGAQCMLWQTSPAASELEDRVLEWLRQMLDLPGGMRGVIQDSASSATLVALLSARERATGGRGNRDGLAVLGGEGARLAVYCSAEAHSSVEKAARVAGFGSGALRRVDTDDGFAMRADRLAAEIAADRAAGVTPVCVVATLGATSTGAHDPLAAIAEVCQVHGVWLHVDAAWAGSALLLPEERGIAAGVAGVDSFVFNPHKWLLTNFDCSAYFVRDPAALERALALVPAYLETPGAKVTDYQNWSVPLGRRFRALKLWFVIRSYGVDGLRAILRRHIEWARELERDIAAHPDFELVAPRSLALLVFRYVSPGKSVPAIDAQNAALVERINDGGAAYLTATRVRGRIAIRLAIGQLRTTRAHVRAAWHALCAAAESG